MARATIGWIHTTKTDRFHEFSTSNILKRPIIERKIQHLPPLNIQYDTPRLSTGKKWTDQSLLSNRSVDTYLAESDAFQRASFANIIEKWKEYEKNKTNELISTFDSHYNMKTRFRQDNKLNRTSEMKYGSGAKYYRFLGNENNPKNDQPCKRHKHRIQEYDKRHTCELLKPITTTKSRSQPYFLPKITKLQSTETTADSSPTARSSVSVAEHSLHTFS